MLSKKYYQVFAELIGESTDLNEFREKLVGFMAEDNERFDWELFNRAIGTARAKTILREAQVVTVRS
jgi:hypothetical protein